MKRLLFISIYFISLISVGQQTGFEWARSIGGSGDDTGNSIAFDGTGNVITTGTFQGSVDFDPGSGVFNLISVGSDDIYIQKLDQNGNFLWAKSMGGTEIDRGYSVTCDVSGNVFTIGHFSGTVDFDPGIGVYNLTALGSSDIFIQKLDSNGNFIWAASMGGTSGLGQGFSITCDESGNVYSTGYFINTVDFDPGAGVFNLTSLGTNPGSSDIFIQKLDQNGNFLWAKSLEGAFSDYGRAISCDGFGNIYTTGKFEGLTDFDPGPNVFNLDFGGMFVLKLDTDGNFLWAKSSAVGYDGALSIALDVGGNIYTTGHFSGTNDFDPGPGVFNLTSAGSDDIFVLKLDVNGNFIWAKSMGGTGMDHGKSLFCDEFGNVYTTGFFTGIADFDPGLDVFNLSPVGSADIFIQKLDTNGDFLWAQSMGGTIGGNGSSIIYDGLGNLYTTGYYLETVDFDPGVDVFNLSSTGGYDIFIQKLSQCTPVQAIDLIEACDSLVWIDGNVYTQSINTPIFVLSTVDGCDSIVKLNLTILNSSTVSESVVVCDLNSYEWNINGQTYTQNGVYSAVFTNSQGCDSVFALDLTFSNSNLILETITACDSYTWITNGQNYTESGQYTEILTNQSGCDSTVILDLIINNSDATSETITECDSYTWSTNGQTYTESGQYTEILTNQNGCDSTVTLNLTITNSNTILETKTDCDSYTWSTNGQTYTESGQYTEILSNQSGCDSTVTLDLTINSSSSSTQTQTGIDSYNWPVNNETYTESGTYTAVIPNAVGCDSTITLDLTLEFTGLDENELSYVAVYPNPTYNSFTLSTKDMINMNYTLLDIQGKVVLTGKIESPEETVDISNLSRGQYNLVFEDESISPISIIKN